ncbi:MAG: hypothetical protein JXM69_05560 [Anaerolineae bacterium]|nr:hypothetical protein [Anaerolineae bacterium]
MAVNNDIVKNAEALPFEERKKIIVSFRETELHSHLKNLLIEMAPESVVEITHGADEFGKDLVMVSKDKFDQTVTAIVVKRGNVRAQTKGMVDEIKSQIQQAISHPAELTNFREPIQVSRVWLMLAGELGSRARKRLENEVNFPNLKTFDMEWLVNHFTKYYPQVFFEGQIMDFLQQKIQDLEMRHLFSKRGKNLSECFINPIVIRIDMSIDFTADTELEQNLGLIAKYTKEQKISFAQLKSLITRNRHILLAGEPGTGKSLALAKLTIDMLREISSQIIHGKSKQSTIEIPILVTAINFVQYSSASNLYEAYIPNQEMRNRYKAKVLFVDGLDEVLPGQRKTVLENGKAFAVELGCPLIITTRPIDLVKSPPPGFEKFEMLPFTFNQAMGLFSKLTNSSKILDALRDGLDHFRFQVAMTPLSLLMLIQIIEENQEVPASTTELYERYSDQILGRYDKDKGIEVLFEYHIKKSFLSSLAFEEFYKKNRIDIPLAEFQDFVAKYLKVYGLKNDEASIQEFICDIERSSILDCRYDIVMFKHRSFLDYFVGLYVYNKRDEIEHVEDLVVEAHFDSLWNDVAFFYSGLKRDLPISLLNKILDYNKEEGLGVDINKFFIGRLLQAAWYSPTQTKLLGIERSMNLAAGLHKQFFDALSTVNEDVPYIIADLLVLALTDWSLKSTFLQQEAMNFFDQLGNDPSGDDVYKMLLLLWATQKFLKEADVGQKAEQLMNAAKKADLSLEDKGRIMSILSNISTNKAIKKSITRHYQKLQKKYPEAFKKILPPPRPGFRQKGKRKRHPTPNASSGLAK